MTDKSLELLKKRHQELAGEAQALVTNLQKLKETEQEMGTRLNHISAAMTEFDKLIKQLEEDTDLYEAKNTNRS
jgi:chaperonin cofactor prefoldin